MEITKIDIQKYLDFLSQASKDYHEKRFKNVLPDTFEVSKGKKYYKVIKYYTNKDGSKGQGSVFCFIDKEGNLYKAASWKAPAKGVRGSLFGEYEKFSLGQLFY